MSDTTLREFAQSIGLDPDHPVLGAAAPALRLRGADDGEGGWSKLGGLPHLPPSIPWPRWNASETLTTLLEDAKARLEKADEGHRADYWQGVVERYEESHGGEEVPLGFLAQLDCRELAGSTLPLPSTGMLYFFFEQEEQTWGFSPEDKGSWRVLYSAEEPSETPREPPEDFDTDYILKEKKLVVEPTWTLPDTYEHEGETHYCWDEEEVESALERLSDVDVPPWHQVGGHPDQIQGDMQEACALVSQGIYLGNQPGLPKEELEALAASAHEWRLLLQFTTDDDLDVMWGDDGNIYFWMREADIRQGRWDAAWFQLQCG